MAFTRISLPFSLLILFSFLVIAFAADYGNDEIPSNTPLAKAPAEYNSKQNSVTIKPDIYKPKPVEEIVKKPYVVKPIIPKEEVKPYSNIAVEGYVYCKTGLSHYPIPGALAKVTCKAVDEVGVVKTVPICSVPTDVKGYFYAIVSNSIINESNLKLKDCKAFLETSPLDTCNIPTDVNKGITGFPLSGDLYNVVNENHAKLYTAQPFFFTSHDQPKPVVPNGY